MLGNVVFALNLHLAAGGVQEPGAKVARAHGCHAVVQESVDGRALAGAAFGAVVVVNDVELLERVVGQHHAVRAVFKCGLCDAVHQLRVVLVHEIQQVSERLSGAFVRGARYNHSSEKTAHYLSLVHLLLGFLKLTLVLGLICRIQAMDQPGAVGNAREIQQILHLFLREILSN